MPLHKEFELEKAHHTNQVSVWKKVFGKVVSGVRCDSQCWFERRFEWCYDVFADDLMFSVTVSENILVSAYILVSIVIKTMRFDKGVKQNNKN